MCLLLMSVAQRLVGQGGDPVIQLQTAFGGGKTHTVLAVYHLASRAVSTDKLEGIPPILDEAGIHELPQAKIAVIDGINPVSFQFTANRTFVNTDYQSNGFLCFSSVMQRPNLVSLLQS